MPCLLLWELKASDIRADANSLDDTDINGRSEVDASVQAADGGVFGKRIKIWEGPRRAIDVCTVGMSPVDKRIGRAEQIGQDLGGCS